jgi:hypothetical protein
MPVNAPVGRFSGKNLFVTIEWITSYALIIITMIIVFAGGIRFLLLYGLCVFIFLLAFVTLQEHVMRKHSEEYSGIEVLDSWIDLDYDLGEEFLFPLAQIDQFPDISPNAQEAVNKFIEGMGRDSKDLRGADLYLNIKSLNKELDEIDKNDEEEAVK